MVKTGQIQHAIFAYVIKRDFNVINRDMLLAGCA